MNPGAEYKLRGRVRPVRGEVREAAADAVERMSGWRPPETWPVVTIEVADMTHIVWGPDGGARMTRWMPTREGPDRVFLELDWVQGRYAANPASGSTTH